MHCVLLTVYYFITIVYNLCKIKHLFFYLDINNVLLFGTFFFFNTKTSFDNYNNILVYEQLLQPYIIAYYTIKFYF